jgi:DNA-binding CsgD family transcriptional regulator
MIEVGEWQILKPERFARWRNLSRDGNRHGLIRSRPMPLSVRTERALESCYDAIVSPEQWPQALQSLAESIGGASCILHAHEPADAPPKTPISTGHERFDDLWVRNREHAPDPHPKRCVSFARAGYASIVEHQIVSDEERKTLPYYWETARPADREWLATSFFLVEGRSWCLPVYRGGSRGPFTPDDAHYLELVGPHVGKLIGLAEKFAAFEEGVKISTLERVRCAAIVIDGLGRVKQANRLAQDLMGDGIDVVRKRLTASDPLSNRRLRQLTSAALSAQSTDSVSYAPIVVNRDETPWLWVEAMPVTAFGSDLFTAGRAVLLLTDLAAKPQPDVGLLRIAFQLTASEARLASKIGSGVGLTEAAAALGVNHETARTQLKAIFIKTRTHRQAELVNLMARLGPSKRD